MLFYYSYIFLSQVKEMAKQGIKLEANQKVTALIKNPADPSITVQTDKGQFGPFECVLFATGRTPLTQGLGLAAAGVAADKSGVIQVDDFQQTSTPGVYAVGDVCSRIQLTPTAIAAGRRLADRYSLPIHLLT